MSNLSIKKTDDRIRRFRKLMEVTGENTYAGAIDVAAKHYLADLQAKQLHAADLPAELVDGLSTSYLPIERDVAHRVGLDFD